MTKKVVKKEVTTEHIEKKESVHKHKHNHKRRHGHRNKQRHKNEHKEEHKPIITKVTTTTTTTIPKEEKKKTTKKKRKTTTKKTKKATKKKTVRKKRKTTTDATKRKLTAREREEMLIENFVGLQHAMTNLSIKFGMLSDNISNLLLVFEEAAKNFAAGGKTDDKDMIQKINSLLDQNKTIARGLVLMEGKLRAREQANNAAAMQPALQKPTIPPTPANIQRQTTTTNNTPTTNTPNTQTNNTPSKPKPLPSI